MNKAGAGRRWAIFLDRDGVICEDRVDYVKTWEEFVFIPGAKDAVRQVNQAGALAVVITNQSGIGKGVMTAESLEEVHARMVDAISSRGGTVDAIYHCPHAPGEGCECRKPRAGMLKDAARELGIDMRNSYLIGDALRDVLAAKEVGVTTVMVRTGRGEQQHAEGLVDGIAPDHFVDDITAGVELIERLRAAAVSGPSVSGPSVSGSTVERGSGRTLAAL